MRKNDDIADLAPFVQMFMGDPTAHCYLSFKKSLYNYIKKYRLHIGFKLKGTISF